MRYVGKIYVMDVLDQVVVSGYVHEYPDMPGTEPETLEFTWQVPGAGIPEPVGWLRDALSRAVPRATPATPAGA